MSQQSESTLSKGFSRRSLIKAAGVTAAAATAGVVGARSTRYAIAGNPIPIKLEWTEVAACHSPVGFGLSKGIYAKHGLDVELFYQGASGQTLIQALATRKAEAGPAVRLAEAHRAGFRRAALCRLAWRLPERARQAGLRHQDADGPQG
ncbi:hypothetical protein [Shinella sp.]|uniref:hypothetical protein n=1 Tax=Shinella sp. TaxID=1870904 RepID=UPI00289CA1F0|nr:hypothetical protein [Shinella sp.]